MVNVRLIAATVFAFLTVAPASAFAGDWRLREVSGAVRIAAPARPAANGIADQVLPVGTSITTGGNGRAVISNGEQRIVVGPNSRTTLAPEAGGMTRILQDLGSALFQIDRQQRPHFRVETPLLAAVVKGTTFTVSVDAQGDRVHVAEGLVEVRANSGNAFGDVGAGATAFVSRGQPAAVAISAPPATVGGDMAAVALTPIDYREASGGLVLNPSIPGAAGSQSAANASGGAQGGGDSGAAAGGTGGSAGGQGGNALYAGAAGGLGSPPKTGSPISGPHIGNGGGQGVVNPGAGNGSPRDGSDPGNGGPGAGSPGNGNGGHGNGSGSGNGDGSPGAGSPGNGNGGPDSGNPGNGNGNGGPGNGTGGPGNGNGSPGAGAPGNGNGGPDAGNPGNGSGGPGAGNGSPGPGSPGNGNGGPGNGSGGAGNGNGGPDAGNPGNGNGNGNGGPDAGNPGNGSGGPGAGNGSPGPGNGNGGSGNPGPKS